jgi:hypothetical protein
MLATNNLGSSVPVHHVPLFLWLDLPKSGGSYSSPTPKLTGAVRRPVQRLVGRAVMEVHEQ